MKKQDVIWIVIQRMTLYGAGAGALLGLLYFWVGTIVGIMVGFVGGMITGFVDGLIVAAFVSLSLGSFVEQKGYRYVVAAVCSAIAAVVILFVVFTLLPGSENFLHWELITLVIFIAVPVLLTSGAAWWAAVRVLTWVRSQNLT